MLLLRLMKMQLLIGDASVKEEQFFCHVWVGTSPVHVYMYVCRSHSGRRAEWSGLDWHEEEEEGGREEDEEEVEDEGVRALQKISLK